MSIHLVEPLIIFSASATERPAKFQRESFIPTSSSESQIPYSQPYAGLPPQGLPGLIISNKRKANDESKQSNSKKSKGDSGDVNVVPEVLRPAIISPATSVSQIRLGVPSVIRTLTFTCHSKDSEEVVHYEILNGRSEQYPTRVQASEDGDILWLDYIPRVVLLVAANEYYCCLGCENGAIIIYDREGKREFPAFILESTPCILRLNLNRDLLCITSIGQLHVWDLFNKQAYHPPTSLAPILDSVHTLSSDISSPMTAPSIAWVDFVDERGKYAVVLSNGSAYSYSPKLSSWILITEPWWAVTSEHWNSSYTRSTADQSIDLAEIHADRQIMLSGRSRMLRRIVQTTMQREPGFERLESVSSIRHLENRLVVAETLESEKDIANATMSYAKALAENTDDPKGQDRIEAVCTAILDLKTPESVQRLSKVLSLLSKYPQLRRIVEIYKVKLDELCSRSSATT